MTRLLVGNQKYEQKLRSSSRHPDRFLPSWCRMTPALLEVYHKPFYSAQVNNTYRQTFSSLMFSQCHC